MQMNGENKPKQKNRYMIASALLRLLNRRNWNHLCQLIGPSWFLDPEAVKVVRMNTKGIA
jgi:hypothetical protein